MTAATNYPSGPEWNQEFRPRMAYHNAIPMNSMSLNHTIIPQTQQQSHESEVLDREWSAQFAHVEDTIVKGKERLSDEGVSSSIPVSSTHVHGDLDSWSHEFDNLSLREFEAANATTPSSKNWEQELANLDNDLESASTEEERQNLMKKMGDIWAELQQAEREEAGAASSGIHNPWDGGFEDFMNEYGKPVEAVDPDPVSAPWTAYKFEPENPFLQYPDAMAQGLRILESPGGSLSQAALAFEAAVQTSQSENSEAWMHLGKVQAENEKEEAAIAALQKSVQLDHANLPALMALSVSYTNEGQELQAYATLNRWLTTKYPNIPVVEQDTNSYTSTYEIHESSTSRFIQAVQSNSGKVDPDLQLGLGVLFYNRSEYDKVIDCFSSALRVRSNDYLLWNRLGATLANSGRSEEAIEAYRRALELKPSFVRCRYNLGVSCINIGSYREAAEHLLGALSLHVVGDHNALGYVNVSENLWDTLRRTFIQMSRMDLAEMTQTDRDVNKYRKEFEF
ncbi:hypothetical protein BDR26DRAFT_824753 [Obelidium mucronatum]|nr:hypothetical protein BDR26DRAFT_824753 [Obelidium mucronatum]